jgi:hypothetical protein
MIKKIFLLLLCVKFFSICAQSSNIDSLYINPNPCDSVTTIYFTISGTDTVSLDVYDNLAQLKKNFYTNAILPSGSYTINYITDSLPNGSYFVRLKVNSTFKIVKLLKVIGVGINERPFSLPDITVYPNPSNDKLIIEFNSDKEEMASISLYDVTGTLVIETPPERLNQSAKYNFDTRGIREGVYLLIIKVGNKQETFKIVKQ